MATMGQGFGYDSAKQRSSPQYGSESGTPSPHLWWKYGEVIINESYNNCTKRLTSSCATFTPVRELTNPANAVEGNFECVFQCQRRVLEVQFEPRGHDWGNRLGRVKAPLFNHAVNTVDNERQFWEGMKSWSQSRQSEGANVWGFRRALETGEAGEKHFAGGTDPTTQRQSTLKKATGQVYQ